MTENYRVHLEKFEGPMDLLLFLIRKNHLDIYDIPIAFLLEEYIKYLETLKELDIDLAAEFLLLAAELAQIKSQMLLPSESLDRTDDQELDPRAELVKRLIEHARYQSASLDLGSRPTLGKDVFSPPLGIEEEERPIAADLDSLWKAFARLLERLPPDKAHQIRAEHISVGARVLELLEIMAAGKSYSWEDFLPQPLTRAKVIVTFLALLEMCRLSLISLHQPEQNKLYIVVSENISATDKNRLVGLDEEAKYGG